MIFYDETNPKFFFGHLFNFSAGLLISCLLQILSVCSRFKMAVNQHEILLSD